MEPPDAVNMNCLFDPDGSIFPAVDSPCKLQLFRSHGHQQRAERRSLILVALSTLLKPVLELELAMIIKWAYTCRHAREHCCRCGLRRLLQSLFTGGNRDLESHVVEERFPVSVMCKVPPAAGS